jgi:enoyl-CoA hydratase/carnithine racemase
MTIEYSTRDCISYIEFNRPEKHNAMRDSDLAELIDALEQFDHDADAQVAILSGRGRSFSSGADVADRLQGSIDDGSSSRRVDERDWFVRNDNWKPVLAAVHGYCLGHAVGTALLCDALVASDDSVFQLVETTLGLAPFRMWGAIADLNLAFACDVALTGRRFTGAEARDAGIVTRLVAEHQHIAGAEELAAQIMKNPPDGVRELVRIRRHLAGEREARLRSVGSTSFQTWTQSSLVRRQVSVLRGSTS